MRSMTGFGEGSARVGAGRIAVEVRSVNARTLDVRLRLPDVLGDASLWAEQLVRSRVRRGRVEVSVVVDGAVGLGTLDRSRAVDAMKAFADVARELGDPSPPPLSLLSAVPGLFHGRGSDAARTASREALAHALDALDVDRRREGREIARELGHRARTVLMLVDRAKVRSTKLPESFRARLTERLARLQPNGIDPMRLEAEVAILADRCDVAEELSRLATHVEHFATLVEAAGRAPAPTDAPPEGRRLDFLIQEAFREATTLAVKAQDAGVSTDVVDMKVELERMREQVQNVE